MKLPGFFLSVLCAAVCGSNCVAGTLEIAYVANQGNSTIEAFNSSGSGSAFVSTSGPQGLALDSAGNLYVCSGNSVLEFTPTGVRSVFSSSNLLNNPVWVAVDGSGDVFVSNYNNNNIVKITPGGSASVYASNISEPEQLALDSQGNLFVVSRNGSSVYKITPLGVSSVFATIIPSSLVLIGLAIDSNDNVYVGDKTHNQIVKYTPSGASSTFATGLSGPKGLAFDFSGNLYVVNNATSNVVVYTPAGTRSVFTTTSLNNADGIAIVSSTAALSVSAAHSTPIYQGGPGSITLTVANTGGVTAGAATVTDTIDPTFTINSYPAGCTNTGQVVTCTIASGSTAASTSFTIYVTSSTSASTAGISNAPTLADTHDTITTSTANDSITIDTQLPKVDSSLAQLILSGTTDNGTCAAGNRTLTATDTIENTSGSTINNPYAEIATLSQGNTLISQSANVTSVAPNANVTFTFHIQLASCVTFQLFFDVYGS